MSRFLAIVNASDPDLLTSIEGANAQVVIAHDGGALVIDGDADAAQAVGQLAAIRAVGPVDSAWDTSSLGLDDDTQAFVDAWNGGYDEEYLAAAEQGFRRGEAWNFPDGCFQTGVEAEDGLVASALPETYGGDDGDGTQVAQNEPTDPGATTDPGSTTDATTDDGSSTDAGGSTDDGSSTDGGQVADNDPSDQGGSNSTDPSTASSAGSGTTDPQGTDSGDDPSNDNPDGTVA